MATSTQLIISDPTKGIKVDAGIVAKSFRDEIKAKIATLKKDGIGERLLLGRSFCDVNCD